MPLLLLFLSTLHISRMCLWLYAGDDVSGVISRSEKIAGTMEALLGGEEIYHYHAKLMMKVRIVPSMTSTQVF